mgnify:CR=1 FL=1
MQKRQKQINEGALDKLQLALDAFGLIPGAGEIADGLNAVISLVRGKPVDALLSVVSLVPAAGDAIGKSSKLVLKAIEPVVGAIKSGEKTADIVKSMGKSFESAKDSFKIIKNFVVKHGDTIKDIFRSVKEADVDAFSKATGIKIPKLARGKTEKILKYVSEYIPAEEILAVFDFISELPLGDQIEESINESYHHKSLLIAMGEPSWINERFSQIGNEIYLIIN